MIFKLSKEGENSKYHEFHKKKHFTYLEYVCTATWSIMTMQGNRKCDSHITGEAKSKSQPSWVKGSQFDSH